MSTRPSGAYEELTFPSVRRRPRDRSQKYRLLRTQIALPALLRVHTLRHEGTRHA
jgi:hypothetical protein